MSPRNPPRAPSAVSEKFDFLKVLRTISASARWVSDSSVRRLLECFSASFTDRLLWVLRTVEYRRASPGVSVSDLTNAPAWYPTGCHFCRQVAITPKLTLRSFSFAA